MSFVLALDQGTTSSRAILFDQECRPRFAAQREFTQHFPQPGWVEHDPEEIWASQAAVAAEVMRDAGIGRESVAAVGITNQRETTVVWNRATGVPVGPAIVWQDRRTATACDRLRATGAGELIRARTGLVLDAYFSATKIAWLLEHVEGARDQAARGELAFGTIDTWLAFRLTNGRCHVTDPSNAARTMLYDIHTGAWDDELLALFRIPRSMLPDVRPSSGVLDDVSGVPALDGVPLAGIAGDQQAALFGQQCTTSGSTKCTYGTGCFLLMNTGTVAASSGHQLLTTVAWGLEDRLAYALEGSVFIGGAVVQWLRDGLGIIETAADVERLAVSVVDSGGVYLVPAFAGLGAPHWDPHARGTIVGITRGTTAAHLARAALEAIAYQVADLLDAMRDDAGTPIPELRVDGGAAANDTLMQFQADLLGIPVVRPEVTETTALGAAMLAGLATGYWSDAGDLATHWRLDRRFEPAGDAAAVAAHRARWSEAVGRSRDWAAPS